MFTTNTVSKRRKLTFDEFKSLPFDVQKEYKVQILEDMRNYHAPMLKELGAFRQDFQMKMPFYDKQARNVVGIFASEFKRENGFYFELITRELEPADESRTVYRIPFNTSFEEEYEMNEKGSYLVPIEELRMVTPSSVAISGSSAILDQPKSKVTSVSRSGMSHVPTSTDDDAPYSDLTIRDYYAIQTGRPVSSKNWLNDLIKSHK